MYCCFHVHIAEKRERSAHNFRYLINIRKAGIHGTTRQMYTNLSFFAIIEGGFDSQLGREISTHIVLIAREGIVYYSLA